MFFSLVSHNLLPTANGTSVTQGILPKSSFYIYNDCIELGFIDLGKQWIEQMWGGSNVSRNVDTFDFWMT